VTVHDAVTDAETTDPPSRMRNWIVSPTETSAVRRTNAASHSEWSLPAHVICAAAPSTSSNDPAVNVPVPAVNWFVVAAASATFGESTDLTTELDALMLFHPAPLRLYCHWTAPDVPEPPAVSWTSSRTRNTWRVGCDHAVFCAAFHVAADSLPSSLRPR
jgi:hypothetical protein